MSSRVWVGVVVAAGIVTAWSLNALALSQDKGAGTRRAKWEYKVVVGKADEPELEKSLNKLGEDGWELTHVTASQPYVSGSKPFGNSNTNTINYTPQVHYLRRPR